MFKRSIKKILLFGSAIMFFHSCIDKNYDISSADSPQLNPELPLPIGFIEKNVSDFLQNSGMDTTFLRLDDDGVLYILYRDTLELLSGNAVQFGDIPNINLPFVSNHLLHETFLIPIDGGDSNARIDSAMLVNSSLTITVDSKIPKGSLTLTFPKGIVFDENETVTIDFEQGNSTKELRIKDESILKLNMSENKKMSFPITALLDTKGSNLSFTNNVNVNVAFSNLNNKILWGYFGGMNFDEGGDKVTEISVFDDIAPSNSWLEFANPIIVCDVRNYVGFDTRLYINFITAIGDSEEATAVFENGKNFFVSSLKAAPKPFYSQSLDQPLIFNEINGQTDRLFNVYPKKLHYNIMAEPVNDHNSNTHFLINEKSIDVILETKLPLSFNSSYIVNTDTLSFDMSNNGVLDNLNELTLWITYKNQLPLGINLEVLFLDENMEQINITSNKSYTIESAPVNNKGWTTAKKEGELEITFEVSDSNLLDKIKYAVLKTAAESKTATLRALDNIRLDLTVRTKVKYDL